jgi:hypothetical protein
VLDVVGGSGKSGRPRSKVVVENFEQLCADGQSTVLVRVAPNVHHGGVVGSANVADVGVQ